MSIRRNKKEQKKICEDWQRSELSQTEYCRRNNIQFYALNRWLRNLRRNTKDIVINANRSNDNDSIVAQDIKFLPIHNQNINSANGSYDKSILEITLPNGMAFKANLSETRIEAYLQRLLK